MNDAAQAILGVSFFGALAVTVRSIALVWMKHLEGRRASAPHSLIEQRLERIEAAVDVVAVEVERIAEAQRFAARLAAERTPGSLPAPGSGPDGRTITPH
jgi:hypothetical protein